MPDDLYHRDIVLWAETQADRLRRMAAGERVNDLDWANVIEEVESVGRSETKGVRSLLRQALIHALKVAAWPDHPAHVHWRNEIRTFLVDARDGFTPSMAQQLDLAKLHASALEVVRDLDLGPASADLRETTDLELGELLSPRLSTDALIARLRAE